MSMHFGKMIWQVVSEDNYDRQKESMQPKIYTSNMNIEQKWLFHYQAVKETEASDGKFLNYFLVVTGQGPTQIYKLPIPFPQKEMHHTAFLSKGYTPYISPVT